MSAPAKKVRVINASPRLRNLPVPGSDPVRRLVLPAAVPGVLPAGVEVDAAEWEKIKAVKLVARAIERGTVAAYPVS